MSNKRIESRLHGTLPVRTAVEAAALITRDASILVSGFGSVGYPKAVPMALAESGRELSLTVVSGGSVGPEIDKTLVETSGIHRRFPYQGQPEMRDAINKGTIAFQDRNIASVGDEVRFGGLVTADIAVIEAVAVGVDWLIPTTSIGHTPSFVDSVDRLIVEVNHAQPLSLQQLHDNVIREIPPVRQPLSLSQVDERIGTTKIRFDSEALIAVVETDMPDKPYQFREASNTDERIADTLISFLDAEVASAPMFQQQVNIQIGVGSLGNALMARLRDLEVGGRKLAYFGEVIQDGLLHMIETGVVDTASATSLALSSAGQREMFDNIERYSDVIVLRPASVSNNPSLIERFGVIAVNSALEVDLYGHVNSTHIGGRKLVNGIGGSGDYSRNSLLAIIALSSTAKDGTISRIVPIVTHVDHTEHDIQIVVTEQGVADLRGLSPRERAKSIVENCAHPSFRPGLEAYLARSSERDGHIAHNFDAVREWNP